MAQSVYAPTVFYYTQELPATDVVEKRNNHVISDPTWNQSIISHIELADNADGTVTAYFTKQSESKKGKHTYRAYLILQDFNGEWKIIKESDDLTDKNVAKKSKVKIPDSAIRGDFDGDGTIEHIWVDGKRDAEGYPINGLTLKSDNAALNGLKFGGVYADLVNLGDLNGSRRDFLGVVESGFAGCWSMYETYGFKDGRWIKPIKDFDIYYCDENYDRVFKSDRKGYVRILYNVLEDDDTSGIVSKSKEVKFNF